MSGSAGQTADPLTPSVPSVPFCHHLRPLYCRAEQNAGSECDRVCVGRGELLVACCHSFYHLSFLFNNVDLISFDVIFLAIKIG